MINIDKTGTGRIDWIDIAKGFTILLVIIGHSVFGLLRGAIFSFHMPLFFILSCITFRFSKDNNDFINKSEKSFKHLFIPAFGIFVLNTVVNLFNQGLPDKDMPSFLASFINTFIAGSGVKLKIGESFVNAIGIPWFLFALFWGRMLFDYIHLRFSSKSFYIIVIICSVLGVCLGKVQWLPFSFDLALAIQPFFLCGYCLKDYNPDKGSIWRILIYVIVWGGLFLLVLYTTGWYLELACRKYALFPVSYLCAIAGTMSMAHFSSLFSQLKWASKPVKFVGRNSIIMIWVHSVDNIWRFAWAVTEYDVINAAVRVGEDLVIFYLVVHVIKMARNSREKYLVAS